MENFQKSHYATMEFGQVLQGFCRYLLHSFYVNNAKLSFWHALKCYKGLLLGMTVMQDRGGFRVSMLSKADHTFKFVKTTLVVQYDEVRPRSY